MASGEPNFYAYVSDSNSWVDVFGLTPGIITYPITGATSSHVPQSGGWQTGINRAWAQEKALLEAGHSGTRPWSAPEIDLIKSTPNSQLNSVMTNAGYTGHHITSKSGNGTLGKAWEGDPRNIVFLENGKHPDGFNKHLYGAEGHKGSFRNSTRGDLIDRKAMLAKHNKKNLKGWH